MSEYLVFVDESGDHSLASIDMEYPVFVLSFCIVRKSEYVNDIIPRIKTLKIATFGHDLAILHERDIRRRTGWFSSLNKGPRLKFMDELSASMEQMPFTLIEIIIDKIKLKQKYKDPEHPYYLALTFGLERLARFLKGQGETDKTVHIVCEARGNKEDKDLELAFRRVCNGGNYAGDKYPFEIVMADKKCNSEGLQLADLTARPAGMSYIRPDQPNRAYEILRDKLYKNGYGFAGGVGRKVFP